VGVIRRLPLDAAAAVLLPVTVVLSAFGSSSVADLRAVGTPGRWVALLLLAGIAVARVAVRGARLRSLPTTWLVAAAFVALAVDSALWSVDPRLTIGRVFTVAVLFVTAGALALGSADARAAATRVLLGVLVGITAVTVLSLVVLVLSHDDAVLAATTGAGWRFRGVGENPNTVPMLLCTGLPLAVWRSFEPVRRARLQGLALVLLFAGEIAFSGTRGALIAAFPGAIVTALLLAPSLRRKLVAALGLVVLALACVALAKLPQPEQLASTPPVAPDSMPIATRGVDAEQVFRLEDEIGFPPFGAYRPAVRRTILGSSGRAQAWDSAVGQAVRRPVVGYGFGTEERVFVDRFFAFEGAFTENTYVGMFLQLGFAGLALFSALLAALAWSGVRAVRHHAGPAAAALGVLLAAMLIGMTQTGLLAVGNIAATSIWICVITLPLLALERSA
jgi:O-antigen ligase